MAKKGHAKEATLRSVQLRSPRIEIDLWLIARFLRRRVPLKYVQPFQ
jgi:hypothetical protein